MAGTPTCNSEGYAWTGDAGPILIPAYDGSNLNCNMVRGDVSIAVHNLQVELNKCFWDVIGPQLDEDGNFGGHTFDALRRAQFTAGTPSDDVYGPHTRHAFAISRGWWIGTYCLWVDA
jgi:hypothetical protein